MNNKEEYISAIILVQSSNLDALFLTLDSIHNDLVKQIIISCNFSGKEFKEFNLKVADYFSNRKISWLINNLYEDEIIPELEFMDYSSFFVKEEWFIVLKSGDTADKFGFNYLRNLRDTNPIKYVSVEDPLHLCVWKKVFASLGGNANNNILFKSHEINGFANLCYKIEV